MRRRSRSALTEVQAGHAGLHGRRGVRPSAFLRFTWASRRGDRGFLPSQPERSLALFGSVLRDERLHLEDIIQAGGAVGSLMAGISEEQWVDDEQLRSAVTYWPCTPTSRWIPTSSG